MTSGLENLPVPTIRRDWKVRVPRVSRSVNDYSSIKKGGRILLHSTQYSRQQPALPQEKTFLSKQLR